MPSSLLVIPRLMALLLVLFGSLSASPPPNYHSTDALLRALRSAAAACPHAAIAWLNVHPHANGDDGVRPPSSSGRLLVVTLSHNVRVASRAVLRGRPAVVAAFGEHGRERVGPELALRMVQRVCGVGVGVGKGGGVEAGMGIGVRGVLRRARLVLLPVVNEGGRRLVEAGRECERRNARGVDLNRNYAVRWGWSDASSVKEEAPGVGVLSEFEARGVDAVVRVVRPVAYVSVHSGGRAVVVPWDSGEEWREGDGAVEAVAEAVRERHCGGCRVGSARALFGYVAYGSAADHMVAVVGVPVVLTLEIWGGPEGHEEGKGASSECAALFNPGAAEFEGVMRNWSGVLETVADVAMRRAGGTVDGEFRKERAAASKAREEYETWLSDDEVERRLRMVEGMQMGWAMVILAVAAVWVRAGRGMRLGAVRERGRCRSASVERKA